MLRNDFSAETPSRPMPQKMDGGNLPGSKAPKPGWNHPVMKMAKYVAWQYAVQRAGGEHRMLNKTRKQWSSLGITGANILEEVRRMLPEFDARWALEGRVSDPGAALYNRVWYMYGTREGKKRGEGVVTEISPEHPLRSKNMAKNREAAIRLYTIGKPVTTKQLIEEGFECKCH